MVKERSGDLQIEGINPVVEALRAGRPIQKLLVARAASTGPMTRLITMARKQGIAIREVPREEIDRRARSNSHQGVIALVAPKQLASVEDMLARALKKGEPPFIVVAVEIQDPQNLGSLIRSAEAAGVHGLVFTRHRSAPITPVVVKASAGASEHLLLGETVNVARLLRELKDKGFWVYGADPQGQTVYSMADLKGPVALVIGGEHRGIPRVVREECDFLLKIPMVGKVNSLNAAVAGAIMIFEAFRQRQGNSQG